MDDKDGYALTSTAALNLVTPRTLRDALAQLGIRWSPIAFDQMQATSEGGLYTWVIGRGHQQADLLDRPVAYVGIGQGNRGGVYGRLRYERHLIDANAGHAHGRGMSMLLGGAVGGPVGKVPQADISWIKRTILASPWKGKEAAVQELRDWLAAPLPTLVEKAEQLCIRAATHIGDTPPPLNSTHATAWEHTGPCDWGGWAVAQRLASLRPGLWEPPPS